MSAFTQEPFSYVCKGKDFGNEGGPVVNLCFLIYIVKMGFYGMIADKETLGDLLVCITPADAFYHIDLPMREPEHFLYLYHIEGPVTLIALNCKSGLKSKRLLVQ
jgi:hypothetical protein